MKQDIEKVLISEDEIQQKVKQLGEQLTSEYSDTFPLAIGVLKGALPFMADLIKHIDTYLKWTSWMYQATEIPRFLPEKSKSSKIWIHL